MKVKTLLGSSAVVAVSLAVTLVLCEVVARIVLNPADYLSVAMVHDDVLGAAVPASAVSHQFDAWGFRNPAVPARVDIVAIGDSHTFGNAATMDDSWPYVLGRLSGMSVYNLAMGGYGPNQYFHLLVSKALKLKPKTIVLGFYMGDDFENAFLITYGLEHWRYLRSLPDESVDFDIWAVPEDRRWHKPLRLWLSQHSVLYQLIFHGPLLGRFQGELQIRNAQARPDSVVLSIPQRGILEAFLPKSILRNLDQENRFILEGMRITFQLLADMNDASRRNDIRFIVAVIPTKEMVFAEYLEHDASLPLRQTIDSLIANERQAREKLFKFLTDFNIESVDVLPALRRSIDGQLYVKSATDMHPNRNGYRIIGEAIFEALRKTR